MRLRELGGSLVKKERNAISLFTILLCDSTIDLNGYNIKGEEKMRINQMEVENMLRGDKKKIFTYSPIILPELGSIILVNEQQEEGKKTVSLRAIGKVVAYEQGDMIFETEKKELLRIPIYELEYGRYEFIRLKREVTGYTWDDMDLYHLHEDIAEISDCPCKVNLHNIKYVDFENAGTL